MARKIFAHLFKEIRKPGFCIECGACEAACQVNAIENFELVGTCEKCEFCYAQCPQTGDLKKLEKLVFGNRSPGSDFGIYEDALSVKTTDSDIQEKCQDGGAVTSMLNYLLDRDYIDAAVVMGTGNNPWKSEPKVASTKEDLIESAGTKYTPGPILLGLRDAVDLYGKDKIAVVGTPCQVKASRRMQFDGLAFYHLSDHVKIVIGLFCMESFNYERLKRFVEEELKIPLEEVSKFDIKKGNFMVYSEKGSKEVEIKDLKDCVNTACSVCPDFASELADISVGAVGSPLGSSTVLLRSGVGIEAFEVAKRDPNLDVITLDSVKPGIDFVKRLSKRKKDSAKKELDRRKREGEPIPPWFEEESG